jgi:hypothetical protein
MGVIAVLKKMLLFSEIEKSAFSVLGFLVGFLVAFVERSLPAFFLDVDVTFYNSVLMVTPLPRLSEHLQGALALHQLTLFPYANAQRRPTLREATVSFRFRSIEFQKKRALPFFLAIELLTQQKPIASLSSRHVLI